MDALLLSSLLTYSGATITFTVAKKFEFSWYMKGVHWTEYKHGQDVSWHWKKVCGVMQIMKPGYVGDKWLVQDMDYAISDGYHWLRPKLPRVAWSFTTWNQNIPKHCFIYWLIMHNRIVTKERLRKFDIVTDGECYLCVVLETCNHLFLQCTFSRLCLVHLQTVPGIDFNEAEIQQGVYKRNRSSILRTSFRKACAVSLVYHIWRARNLARVDGFVLKPDLIAMQIVKE